MHLHAIQLHSMVRVGPSSMREVRCFEIGAVEKTRTVKNRETHVALYVP